MANDKSKQADPKGKTSGPEDVRRIHPKQDRCNDECFPQQEGGKR